MQATTLAQQTFDFFERIRGLSNTAQISRAVVDEMKTFGYECVTCWSLPPPGHNPAAGVLLNTRPEEYVERYVEQNYVVRDPVIKHLKKSTRPFSWTDVRKMDALSKEDRTIIDEARDFGVNDGFVVPIVNISGSMSLFSPCGGKPDLSGEARSAVEMMGIMAAQLLRRAALEERNANKNYKPLSAREREILQWVAYGKSDDDIGELLSLSACTVLKHVENAKRKLDAAKRTVAVITAIQRGEISY